MPVSRRTRWISGFTALTLLVSLFTVTDGVAESPESPPVQAGTVELICEDSSLPPPSTTIADPGQTTVIQQDGSTVEVPPTAVDAPTAIEAESLCASQLPPLDPGMTNVTEGLRDGYRFTPHMTFDANLHITVPYDDALIPAGMSEQDVQMYYYDTVQARWVALQRDSLDQSVDQVESLSDHFTDMIAATVTVPDHPENVSLNPTSVKDLKDADPSAGVGLMQPPSGTSEGDARTAYPIELPKGRQGMAPELDLGYSSAAGNGWLGVGWDLSVPSIGIDTRWGVPRYDAAVETETYVVGGAQLSPVAHRGPPQARTAEKTFQARVEGAFNKIVRHGDAPTNYWWEVTDSEGVRSFYGGDPENGAVAAARLADDAGNVFRWALRESRDLHGNAVRYAYQTVSDAGVAGGTVLGRQLYLRSIDYTRKGATAGPYTVKFVRDSELPGYSRRSDVVIDARGGFKMVTAELLSRIEVAFQGNPVRSYDLAYTEGAFEKKLLASVTQRGANNTALGTHTFSYYDDIRNAAGDYDAFAPVDWQIGADAVTAGLLGHGQASAISGSLSTSVGGHLYAGFNPTAPTKQGSAGGKVGYTHTTTDGKLALVDLNGDDLPDKVFKTGSGVSVRFNTSGPDGSTDFGPPVAVPTLPALARESADMVSYGAEAYFTANVFANHANTTTKDTTYFSDVNGDGLVDLVDEGKVLFNHLDADGVPTFTTSSGDTSVPIGAAILDPSGLTPSDAGAIRNNQFAHNPLADVVRRWTAPFTGTVQITGDAALIKDTSAERAAYIGADGVRVAIQHNGASLWALLVGPTDYTAKTPAGVDSIAVTKGDRLYFRVGSRIDGSYDQVSWDPVIQYVSSTGTALPAAPDANGLDAYHYQASEDFTLAGRRGAYVTAPLNGVMRLTGVLRKLARLSDGITVTVAKNGATVASWAIPATTLADTPTAADITVAKGDTIALGVAAPTPVNLSKLDWAPSLYYLSSPDLSTVTDEAGNPLVQLHPPYDIDSYPVNDLTAPQKPWTAPASETITITAKVSATSSANGSVVFIVKRRGAAVGRCTITITDGAAGSCSRTLAVASGDPVYFDFVVADPALRADITATTAQVTRPELAAVTVRDALHSAADQGMLAAPYRGWNYIGYNGVGARATQPIVEADLNQAYDQDSTYDPRTAKAHPFLPFPEEKSWRGADDSAWVKASTMSSSRQGLDQIGVTTASQPGGGRAVARLSRTTQDAVGAGVSFLSGSTSDGGSASEVDFLDLNGDRFPDVVSDGKVQYSTLTGGLEPSSRAVPGLGKPRDSDASATNVGVGGSPAHFAANGRGEVDTSNSGPVRGNKTGSQMVALGLSAGLGKGASTPNRDLLDVNGDGLADVVSQNDTQLMVALNLGYGFAAAEPWGAAMINDGASENGTIGASLGFNTGLYDFAGGLSLTKNKSRSRETLEDVNGDGLLDRVLVPGGSAGMRVGLNTGNGFAAPVGWSGSLTGACKDGASVGLAGIDWANIRLCSGSTGFGAGAYFTVGIGPLCLGGCYVILNPGADTEQSMARDEASLRDVDGDGYADHLASSDDGQLKVARNRTGRTNLLKSVSRPLGASFALEYTRDGNTTANPHSRWVLSKVTVNDGHSGDGANTQASTYSYSGGVYSRLEREFYGYAQVTQQQLNTLSANAVYRKIVRNFETDSFYTHGLLTRERIYNASGGLFADTENTYVLRDVATGAEPADAGSTTATIFPMLTRIDERFYEGGATAVKSTATVNHYDAFGDIDVTTDHGDTGTADDVVTRIGYTSCPTTGVRTANSIAVDGGGTLMRRRESAVNCATGNVFQVRQYLANGSAAVTDLGYTGDGNLLKVVDPVNVTGQRATLTYAYDPATRTYVERITDNFGLTSTATHDLRFGSVLTQTDVNGNSTTYAYDEFGRATSFTGPYEQGSSTPTIRFEYHPEAADPWAITRHLDKFRSATDTIDTVVFIDGLGRTIQTKKDTTVHTGTASAAQAMMAVSGLVTYDAFGRQVAVRYPVTEPLGTPGVFNTSADTVAPTRTSYDVLDRVLGVTFPDGTKTTTAYAFGEDRSGAAQFQQAVTDANGHQKVSYRDVNEQLVGLKEYHTPAGGAQQAIWTSYAYDPLGQLITVRDAKDNVTRQSFDNLGRRTVIDNPDTGKTETSYDLASNTIAKVTANLRAVSQQVSYGYDVDRLVSINYPLFPANNVTYAYGAPGASDNQAGRITHVTDQAGSEDRFYGKLGEVTKEVRTVVGDTGSSPKTYTTSYVYDTFGRQQSMTYPDGEVLTYRYDSGGMVRAARGVKGADNYAYVTRLEYDKFGQKAFVKDGNGVETSYAFDPVMQRLSNTQAGPLIAPNGTNLGNFQNLSYTYDKLGNVTSVANDIPAPSPPNFGGPSSQTFVYDDLDRLTGATGSYEFAPGKVNRYSYALGYDSLHNTTSKNQVNDIVQGSGTPVTQGKTAYSYDYAYTGPQPHAPSHIGDKTYSYDANGNQSGWTDDTSGQRRSIVWDEENRIQSIFDNGQEQTYKYDDAGQRIIKRGPQGETAYVNQWFTMRNGQIGTKHVFIGTTRVASKLVKSDVYEKDSYYFHTDQLSSTNAVTDSGGKLYEHLEYFPSGEAWIEEKSNTQRTPYRFTGKELDEETGLYYFGARYYDPRTGLWPSTDPALAENLARLPGDKDSPEPDVAAPTFLNLYNYADANPLTKIDPDGRAVKPWQQNLINGTAGAIDEFAVEGASAYLLSWVSSEVTVDSNSGLYLTGRVGSAAATIPKSALKYAAKYAGKGFVRLTSWVGTRRGTAATNCLNSFTSDTPVRMADGSKKSITDVKVGDYVLATDPETGQTDARPVTALIRHGGPHTMVDVSLSDGSMLTATDGHPFWDATTGKFTDAIDLRVGNKVLADNGRVLRIAALRIHQQTLIAYNLEIGGIHTYYAGTTPVLVHNTCKSTPAKKEVHGNSRSSTALTYLYQLYDAGGKFLKWGITSNPRPKGRYTTKKLNGGQIVFVEKGSRSDMLDRERWLVERYPGEKNNESWAGKKKQP